jgi:hypothetical protein
MYVYQIIVSAFYYICNYTAILQTLLFLSLFGNNNDKKCFLTLVAHTDTIIQYQFKT